MRRRALVLASALKFCSFLIPLPLPLLTCIFPFSKRVGLSPAVAQLRLGGGNGSNRVAASSSSLLLLLFVCFCLMSHDMIDNKTDFLVVHSDDVDDAIEQRRRRSDAGNAAELVQIWVVFLTSIVWRKTLIDDALDSQWKRPRSRSARGLVDNAKWFPFCFPCCCCLAFFTF
jgi:hypothetical protein